jgi:hypothetical protein
MATEKPMSRKRFRTLSSQLADHTKWIHMASCKKGIGSPFGDDGVSITAVIEHFGEDQQKALNTWLNTNMSGLSRFMGILQATPMDQAEGRGIQFTPSDGVEKGYFIAELNNDAGAEDGCLELKSYLSNGSEPTSTSFFNQCKIRFWQNKRFGKTTARTVVFDAYNAVPLCFMIEIKTVLESSLLCSDLGLGEVAITGYTGLPDQYSDRSMLLAYKNLPACSDGSD